MCDAPAHITVEELLEMSWEDWNESINKLDTRTKTAAEKDVDRCSKTGAEYIKLVVNKSQYLTFQNIKFLEVPSQGGSSETLS